MHIQLSVCLDLSVTAYDAVHQLAAAGHAVASGLREQTGHISQLRKEIAVMSTSLSQEIADLQASVAAARTSEEKAAVLISGFAAKLDAAVAAAKEAGATTEQLQAITQMKADLDSGSADLVAAMATQDDTGADTTGGAGGTVGGAVEQPGSAAV